MEDKQKLQDEIIKADIKSVEKIWKDVEDDYSLEALLNKMTKDELVKIAKRYSVKGITTLKKADAVEKLKEIICEKYTEAIALAEDKTLKFLEELVKDNGIRKYKCDDLIYSNFLRNRGLAFTGTINEELHVLLPQELKDILGGCINKECMEIGRLNREIIEVIAGMTYYYGVVTVEIVKETIEKLFTESYKDEYIKALISNGEELGYDYVIDGELIYHIDVEDVEHILELQKEKPSEYYKFDKKTLMKAGKPDYIEENKQGENLKRAIGELFVIDKNILREEMDGFTIAIKNEMAKEEAIDTFLQAYEIESDEEKNIFTYELQQFAKSIKRWSLKGYTENEIEKNQLRVVNEVKIGRNDPCNCGSGKKYKKCCGK